MISRVRILSAPLLFARVLFAAVAVFAAACSRPASYEQFIRAEDAPDGIYEFTVPVVITDTASTFDVSFYTVPLAGALQLEVVWMTTGELLRETVWFPAGEHRALYRSGISTASSGDETTSGVVLRVKPLGAPEDFRGLGIICKRNDGTR